MATVRTRAALLKRLWVWMRVFERMRYERNTRQTLIALLFDVFAQAPASEWLQRLTAADIPASMIHTVGEAVNDPQTLARGLIVEIKHPTLDLVRSIANPVRMSSTPVVYRLPPASIGRTQRGDTGKFDILQGTDCGGYG